MNISDLLANAQQRRQMYENALHPGRAENRLSSLTEALQSQVQQSPFETAGYQGQIGTLTDLIRQSSQADAGRAMATGTTPGMAIAAGAGARSQAMASGVRNAAAGAEATQERKTGMLTSLLGQTASLEQNRSGMLLSLMESQLNREERQKDRKARERGSFLGSLTSLAGMGVGALLGGPLGASMGYGLASMPRPDSAMDSNWNLRL